jgi:hypothetical protein
MELSRARPAAVNSTRARQITRDVYWRPKPGGRGADDMNVGTITSFRAE